jgi:hypothetical protein
VDLIPSLLEAPRETLDTLTMPEPVKIGGAEFPIWLVADEDIKNTDQDGVGLIPSDFVVHRFRPPMEEAIRRLWSQVG